MKQNCWEIKKCGRESGGCNIDEFGICPASDNCRGDGINDGKNSGRVCWAVAGTFCNGKIQGEFAEKQSGCMECEFFKQVLEEEKENFHFMLPGQSYRIPENE